MLCWKIVEEKMIAILTIAIIFLNDLKFIDILSWIVNDIIMVSETFSFIRRRNVCQRKNIF